MMLSAFRRAAETRSLMRLLSKQIDDLSDFVRHAREIVAVDGHLTPHHTAMIASLLRAGWLLYGRALEPAPDWPGAKDHPLHDILAEEYEANRALAARENEIRR